MGKSDMTGSTGYKGVDRTYGAGRGGKGVEKTVVSKSENDSGAASEVVSASRSLYSNAKRDGNPGERGTYIPAIQER